MECATSRALFSLVSFESDSPLGPHLKSPWGWKVETKRRRNRSSVLLGITHVSKFTLPFSSERLRFDEDVTRILSLALLYSAPCLLRRKNCFLSMPWRTYIVLFLRPCHSG